MMKPLGKIMKSWMAIIAIVYMVTIGFTNAQFGDGPPRYSMSHLPQTKFTCEGKITSRYYADQETDCQMFHVCTKMTSRDISDFKFLCPNGTVFDQEHQVCADYYQVVCLANIGTNPLGQIFELYKLNSKESTNRQEFGEAPIRDPDYIGQNSLGGGEDFQAEEYNNNKLAASQNSLPYHTYDKSNVNNIFYQSVATRRPTTTTTEAYIPPTTTQPRVQQRTTTIVQPIFRSPIPTEEATIDFSDFNALSRYQNQFHKNGFNSKIEAFPSTTTAEPYYTSTTYSPFLEYSTEQRYYETESTVAPTTTYRTTQRPRTKRPTTTQRPTTQRPTYESTSKPQIEEEEPFLIDFSDFSALSKYQHNFHHNVKQGKPDKTTTQSPIYHAAPQNEFDDSFIKPIAINYAQTPDTALTIATTRRPTAGPPLSEELQEYEYKDFASLSKFQNDFQHSFTQTPPTTNRQDYFRGEVIELTTPATTSRIRSTTRRPTQAPPDVDKIDFSDFAALNKFQHSFHHSFTERASTEKPRSQLNEFENYNAKTTTKPVRSTTTTTTTPPPPSYIQPDSEEFGFNDFSSLSKFQHDFHHSFTEAPTTASPAPTKEYQTIQRHRTFPTTTTIRTTIAPRTTQPPPPPPIIQDSEEFQFTDFASLSKYQNKFHKSFTQAPTARTESSENHEIPNHEFSDFNTKPRTETLAPFDFQYTTTTTTRRPAVYQSTFRTTFNDITTSAPQTFQQQSTRFGDDFFIRQPSSYTSHSLGQLNDNIEEERKPIKFSSPIYQNPEKQKQQPTKKSQAQLYDHIETEIDTFEPRTKYVEPIRSTTNYYNDNQELVISSSARPIRRGRKRVNSSTLREKNFQSYEPEHQYSKRVETVRFANKESFGEKETSHVKSTDEILHAEASVFRGPAHSNNYFTNQRETYLQVTQPPTQIPIIVEEPKPTTTTATTGNIFGRRVRPLRDQDAQGPRAENQVDAVVVPDVIDEGKKSGKTTRVITRLRTKTTAETITTSTLPELSTTVTTPTTNKQPSRVRTKTVTINRRLGIGLDQVTPGPIPHRDRPPVFSPSTTTSEPELVTASDEEVVRVRELQYSNNKNDNEKQIIQTYETNPEIINGRITTKKIKIISKIPLKSNTKSTKNSDYDYAYFDTERDHDYSDISTSFGNKPSKTIVKS